jgi:hypothetical protein
MKGFKTERGILKWRMPSPAQSVVIILIFAIPVAAGVLLHDIIPSYLRLPLAVMWFIIAYAVYIFILTHGKGKQKYTITEPSALRGEFTIDNNWIAYSSIYPFAASVGAALNGYYAASVLLIFSGFGFIMAAKYYRRKLRIDDNGSLFVIQKGEERLIDLNTVMSVEGKTNRMSTEPIYKPVIIFNFKQNLTEPKPLKLKITLLRSVELGTYSPSLLILQYVKYRCLAHGFTITYLNAEETNWLVENKN